MSCNDHKCKHEELPIKVLESAAGYYIGQFCPFCGPYDRLSKYFETEGKAQRYLTDMYLAVWSDDNV